MTLRDYVRKRRIGVTPEPGLESQGARSSKKNQPIFVVQLHHARARHYDFRLEVDGVLRSWAVPKGPSLRVGEKRLAVEVEDHPLSYASFEGDIPPGHYGAGHVDVFDTGTWSPIGDPKASLAAGKLEFELHGNKLRGRWKLVRTAMKGSKTQWLLIKSHDAHARDASADDLLDEPVATAKSVAGVRPATKSAKKARAIATTGAKAKWAKEALRMKGAKVGAVPADFKPELTVLREISPEGDDWLHEVKWDGYRLLAAIDDGKPALRSRTGLAWTADFPVVVNALTSLALRDARFDGELVVLDGQGRSDFSALQHALKTSARNELRYLIFDLLAIDGVDLRGCRLIDRKRLLEDVLARRPGDVLAFSKHVVGHGAFVFGESRKQGLEGIVSKRVDSRYASGRSGDWIKAKHALSDDFVIVGMTRPKGSRQAFGALLMARRVGKDLQYVGRVGTGFDEATLKRIHAELKPLIRDRQTVELPAHTPLRAKDVVWLQPRRVAEVAFRGWAKEGLLRQASFMRMRTDKEPADATGDSAPPSVDALPRITHGDRWVYKAAKINKQQVADYYRAVAPLLLREIAGRPLSIVRCPDGAEGSCFFQKHHAASLGKNVGSIAVEESGGGQERYIAVSDADGILELVQMNVLEFHPWGCADGKPGSPDRLVFDLDPAEGMPWKQIVKAAQDVRARLQEAGMDSFARLSGGKGVHVVAPIARGSSWDEAKAFCRAFANVMAAQEPDRYIATASKAQRKGKIFIDWLRNGRGATSVASWSLRARKGAPVAMPVRWDDLARAGSANAYDLRKALRAASEGFDPWQLSDLADQKLPALTTR